MKSGARKFHKDAKITSFEGNEREFKENDTVVAQVVHRKNGICQLADGTDTYKCQDVRGASKIIKD